MRNCQLHKFCSSESFHLCLKKLFLSFHLTSHLISPADEHSFDSFLYSDHKYSLLFIVIIAWKIKRTDSTAKIHAHTLARCFINFLSFALARSFNDFFPTSFPFLLHFFFVHLLTLRFGELKSQWGECNWLYVCEFCFFFPQ